MPTIRVKNAGAWTELAQLFVKDAGTWKQPIGAWTKAGGVWQKCWPPVADGTTGVETNTPGPGSVVVPAGVTRMQITIAGGGGGGGSLSRTASDDFFGGGGGGSSGLLANVDVAVTPGETVNYVCGNLGAGGIFDSRFYGTPGDPGLHSSVTALSVHHEVSGGQGGQPSNQCGGSTGCGGAGGTPNGVTGANGIFPPYGGPGGAGGVNALGQGNGGTGGGQQNGNVAQPGAVGYVKIVWFNV